MPRALADDLLIVAVKDEECGEAATLEAFLAGVQGTLDYVGEMGGRVSIKKCVPWPSTGRPSGRTPEVRAHERRSSAT